MSCRRTRRNPSGRRALSGRGPRGERWEGGQGTGPGVIGQPRSGGPATPAVGRAASTAVPGQPQGDPGLLRDRRSRVHHLRRSGVVGLPGDLHQRRLPHRGGAWGRPGVTVRDGAVLPDRRPADAPGAGPEGVRGVPPGPRPATGSAVRRLPRGLPAADLVGRAERGEPVGPAGRADPPSRPGPFVVRARPAAVLHRLRDLASGPPRAARARAAADLVPGLAGRGDRREHPADAAVVPDRLLPGVRAAPVAVAPVPGAVHPRGHQRRARLVGPGQPQHPPARWARCSRRGGRRGVRVRHQQ